MAVLRTVAHARDRDAEDLKRRDAEVGTGANHSAFDRTHGIISHPKEVGAILLVKAFS